MDDHLIAYFDILGFSDAIRRSEPDIADTILQLLTSFSEAERSFQKNENRCSVFHNVSIEPSISSFSDHIIYSWPLSQLNPTPYFFVDRLASIVGSIVLEAMQFGCLIRGAITSGPLYHERGVVVGKALLDAVELEAKFAKYPRIILSDKIANFAKNACGEVTRFRDDDGIWCLHYMRASFDKHRQPDVERNKQWIANIRRQCDEQIETLRTNSNSTGLCYWRWFRTRFDRMISELDPRLTGEA